MVSIVYPYVHNYAKFQELLYSMRSIAAFFQGEYKVFVIGDKPSWLSDEVTFISAPVIGKVPVKDVVSKMRTIIAREDVSENFIWMNDDEYLMNPVSEDDLKIPKAIEDLDNVWTRRKGKVMRNTQYRINMWNTFAELKRNNLPAVNTCTHLPFYYNKKMLGLVLDRYNAAENKYLITLLYHNTLYDKADYQFIDNYKGYKVALYLNRVSSLGQLEAKCANAKFFNHSDTGYRRNHNGSGSIIQQFLRKKFPTKSKFEI
jgi:hypothetical protein